MREKTIPEKPNKLFSLEKTWQMPVPELITLEMKRDLAALLQDLKFSL